MEVANVARAHGVKLPADHRSRVFEYAIKLPPSTRSSLLIDLSQGKRIEVEALQGSVVRRGANVGVPTPIMAALYAVLKPHANGTPCRSSCQFTRSTEDHGGTELFGKLRVRWTSKDLRAPCVTPCLRVN